MGTEEGEKREQATWIKVRRLFKTVDLLQLRGWSAQELADKLGVPKRSVLRDLQDLRKMDLGLEGPENNLYSMAVRAPHLRPVEALAVHAATRLLYHHAASKNRDYLIALEKLTSGLPVSLQDIVRRSVQNLSPQFRDDGVLERVATAWTDRQYIAFDYLAPNGVPERRELAVYFVEISRSNLAPYVIGFERQKRGAIRTFKLSRMTHVTMLRDTYEIPADFNPRLYLSDAWGVVGNQTESVIVTLRFAQEVRYRVLEGGYPNLTVEQDDPERGLTIKVRAGVDYTGLPRELLPWILGWGPRVEVMDPPGIRAHWLQEARAVVAKFDRVTT